MRRRTILLMATTMALAVFVTSGVAVAANLTGTPKNDNITGTATNDIIDALAGDDTVQGLGAGDDIRGRGGADTLNGDTGNVSAPCSDSLYGGRGTDTLVGECGSNFYSGGPGSDNIDAAFTGDPNNPVETVNGGAGNDTINADDGIQDQISCGMGTDDHVNADNADRVSSDCEHVT